MANQPQTLPVNVPVAIQSRPPALQPPYPVTDGPGLFSRRINAGGRPSQLCAGLRSDHAGARHAGPDQLCRAAGTELAATIPANILCAARHQRYHHRGHYPRLSTRCQG